MFFDRLLWTILESVALQLVSLEKRELSMLSKVLTLLTRGLSYTVLIFLYSSILFRYAKEILQKEMLPHVGVGEFCETKKAYYFGYVSLSSVL